MNYQKMSKTALLKRCIKLEGYIRAIQQAENIHEAFSVMEVRNQRQLGIVQALRVVRKFSSIFEYHGYWLGEKKIPTRKEVFENAKVLERFLNKIWKQETKTTITKGE